MNDFAVKDIQWIAEGNGLPLLHDQYFISITTRQVQVMQDAHHAIPPVGHFPGQRQGLLLMQRSEEHTSELQSLMRISYAVFCLKNKKYITNLQAQQL